MESSINPEHINVEMEFSDDSGNMNVESEGDEFVLSKPQDEFEGSIFFVSDDFIKKSKESVDEKFSSGHRDNTLLQMKKLRERLDACIDDQFKNYGLTD